MRARSTKSFRSARYAGTAWAIAVLFQLNAVHADDGKGLQRGANPAEVSISGVSAGAAMALQYAVAHSASVMGVGAIAGPPWGCAEGRVSQAINQCMCGTQALPPKAAAARAAARRGEIDPLVSDRPAALKRAYVFHSDADDTVKKPSGAASVAFLADFVGPATVADRGNATDRSNLAKHGIISPAGKDDCSIELPTDTYIRRCGAEDNAGKLLLALHAPPGTGYDARLRQKDIPDSEVWRFRQLPLIKAVSKDAGFISLDRWFFFPSARRANLDMADDGYLYVPPVCRKPGSKCGVHIALHGCRQDAWQFATRSGYNNWAAHYRLMIVYPAIAPDSDPSAGNICRQPAVPASVDLSFVEPNANGCWDWWGYLDNNSPDKHRYLGRDAPQMRVIDLIRAAVTAPLPGASGPVPPQP